MVEKLPHTCTSEFRHMRTAFIDDLHFSEFSVYPVVETYLLDVACAMKDKHDLQLFVTPQFKVHSKYFTDFGVTLSMRVIFTS